MEEWRTIYSFPWHSVSNEGRVRNEKTNTILKQRALSNGNQYVSLNALGKGYPKNVAVLVANAFIPNPTNATRVDFIDGDKTNCHVDNLKWHERVKDKRKGER